MSKIKQYLLEKYGKFELLVLMGVTAVGLALLFSSCDFSPVAELIFAP